MTGLLSVRVLIEKGKGDYEDWVLLHEFRNASIDLNTSQLYENSEYHGKVYSGRSIDEMVIKGIGVMRQKKEQPDDELYEEIGREW